MMKKLFTLCMVGIAAAAFAKPAADIQIAGQGAPVDDVSYSFGVVFGVQFADSGVSFNYSDFAKGFKDAVEGNLSLSEDEALSIANAAYRAALDKKNEENKAKEAAFLAENAKKDGVITTESGLQYRIIKDGPGPTPLATDTVQAHYKGSLIDGTVFDSSYDDGEPVEFSLSEVIDGWAEGLQLIGVGGKYELFIPSDLAYGADGAGSIIPPYSTLIFEVELLSILEPDETQGGGVEGEATAEDDEATPNPLLDDAE
ncbi:MAG: FKBP-type peptidyl-prolyl cis-trans isomerase [Treponema sp.]|jgi:FKBP-type peptidyl-prolyl cis-trans isomerase FkpA|nr:FKBP-type peptidyl-prolyl cis-trans isomerase [Treponema sp.]